LSCRCGIIRPGFSSDVRNNPFYIQDIFSLRETQNIFAAAGLPADDLTPQAASHWQSDLASMDLKFSKLTPAEKFAAIEILAERARSKGPRFVDELRTLLLQHGFAAHADQLAPLRVEAFDDIVDASNKIEVEVDQELHNSEQDPAKKGEPMSNNSERIVFIIHGRDEVNRLKLEKLLKNE
jgi:hypothetical protein